MHVWGQVDVDGRKADERWAKTTMKDWGMEEMQHWCSHFGVLIPPQ
jgi:hypothetical protein